MITNLITPALGIVLLLFGILFFAHGVKNNASMAVNFFYSVMGGIVAGIIIVMYTNIKDNLTTEVFILFFGMAMFFFGLVTFIVVPKISK